MVPCAATETRVSSTISLDTNSRMTFECLFAKRTSCSHAIPTDCLTGSGITPRMPSLRRGLYTCASWTSFFDWDNARGVTPSPGTGSVNGGVRAFSLGTNAPRSRHRCHTSIGRKKWSREQRPPWGDIRRLTEACCRELLRFFAEVEGACSRRHEAFDKSLDLAEKFVQQRLTRCDCPLGT